MTSLNIDNDKYFLANVAYHGYCNATGFKSLISGDILPIFEELSEEIKDAWGYAANDVAQATMGILTNSLLAGLSSNE